MAKSRVKHKKPIMGLLYSPYQETGMRAFGLYPWWAFCLFCCVTMYNPQTIAVFFVEQAISFSNELKTNIALNTENLDERDDLYTKIIFEYFSLFLHLLNRELQEKKFDIEEISKYVDDVTNLILDNYIYVKLKGTPENNKEVYKGIIIQKFQETEYDYSECHLLYDRDNPFSDKSILGKFQHKITKIIGHKESISRGVITLLPLFEFCSFLKKELVRE